MTDCFWVWSMCQPTKMSTVSCGQTLLVNTCNSGVRAVRGYTSGDKGPQDLCWTGSHGPNPHPEVGAEDVWVAASHLENAPDTLAEQLWCVDVLQDGLQVVHHQLKHTQQSCQNQFKDQPVT